MTYCCELTCVLGTREFTRKLMLSFQPHEGLRLSIGRLVFWTEELWYDVDRSCFVLFLECEHTDEDGLREAQFQEVEDA